MDNNYQYVLDFFINAGWEPHQATGIVANLLHESGLNPTITGDNGASIGIAQWQGPRRKALESFAAANKMDPMDLDTQLNFVNHELHNTESGAAQKLRATTTPHEATQSFSDHYERPGEPMMEQRLGWADRLWNMVTPGQAHAAEGPGGGGVLDPKLLQQATGGAGGGGVLDPNLLQGGETTWGDFLLGQGKNLMKPTAEFLFGITNMLGENVIWPLTEDDPEAMAAQAKEEEDKILEQLTYEPSGYEYVASLPSRVAGGLLPFIPGGGIGKGVMAGLGANVGPGAGLAARMGQSALAFLAAQSPAAYQQGGWEGVLEEAPWSAGTGLGFGALSKVLPYNWKSYVGGFGGLGAGESIARDIAAGQDIDWTRALESGTIMAILPTLHGMPDLFAKGKFAGVPRLGDVKARAEGAGPTGPEFKVSPEHQGPYLSHPITDPGYRGPERRIPPRQPTDFVVGPEGEVMAPGGVQPGVPDILRPRWEPAPRSHEVPVDMGEVYPPGGAAPTPPPITPETIASPDIITPIEKPLEKPTKTRRTRKPAQKTAPPTETAETPVAAGHEQITPEIQRISKELDKVDRWMRPGLEKVNPFAYRALMTKKQVLLEKAQAEYNRIGAKLLPDVEAEIEANKARLAIEEPVVEEPKVAEPEAPAEAPKTKEVHPRLEEYYKKMDKWTAKQGKSPKQQVYEKIQEAEAKLDKLKKGTKAHKQQQSKLRALEQKLKFAKGELEGAVKEEKPVAPQVKRKGTILKPAETAEAEAKKKLGKPLAEAMRGEPEKPKLQKPIAKSAVKGAHEPAVPTRVAVRDRPNGMKDEYIVSPPGAEVPEWRLVHNMVGANGEIVKTSVHTFAKTHAELDNILKTDQQFKLPGTRRVRQPLEQLETKGINEANKAFAELDVEEGQERWFDEEVEPSKPPVKRRPRGKMAGETPPRDPEGVQDVFNRNRAASEAKSEQGVKKWYKMLANSQGRKDVKRDLRIYTSDTSARTADILNASGDLGKEAQMQMRHVAGANYKAWTIIRDVIKNGYTKLNKNAHALLDDLCLARRVSTIDGYKGVGKVDHPEGLTGPEADGWMERLQQAEPELFADLNRRADVASHAMRYDALDMLVDHQVLGESEAEALRNSADFYMPRKALHHIDPHLYNVNIGGQTISVSGSGLKPLEEGTLKYLEKDSLALTTEYINRCASVAFRNRANRAALKLADEISDNGFVRRLKKGERPKSHETVLYVKEGVGEPDPDTGRFKRVRQVRMAMDKEIADGWLVSDAQFGGAAIELCNKLMLAKPLKALATGYNPVFGAAQFPMDIMTVFWSTHEYSSNPLRFALEMANDLRVTRKSAWYKSDARFNGYVDRGGGMKFLARQGMLQNYSGPWKSVLDLMSVVGNTTELWVRLALENRALRNGRTPLEATNIARSYIDFNQGGLATKFAERAGCTYINAAAQGARAIGRATHQHPGKMAMKVAWISALSAMNFLYFATNYPDLWNQMDDDSKNRYWLFPLPVDISYTDRFGNKKSVIGKVPKDWFGRCVSTITEGAISSLLKIPFNEKRLSDALWDFIPWISGHVPPTVKAYFGYTSNWDKWRERPIWKGQKTSDKAQEYYTGRFGRRPTHPLAVEWGKLSGMSPERSIYAIQQVLTTSNPGVMLPAELIRIGMGGMAAGEELNWKEIITQIPIFNKFLTTTTPYAAYGEKHVQYAEDVNTRKVIQNRSLDAHAETYLHNPTRENYRVVFDFIREQERADQKDLIRRFKFNKQIFGLENRDWWLHTYSLPAEAKAQAFMDRYQKEDEEGKRQLLRDAGRVPGFGGDKFKYYLRKLMYPKAYATGG